MLALLALLAFIAGFSVHRGTNCSVVAAHQMVRRRDPTRLTSFIVGGATAMAIATPLAWLYPDALKTAPSFGLTWVPAIGGACYGLGALINGACALGTFVRISEGRLPFLATLPGIGLGAFAAIELGLPGLRGEAVPAVMAAPGAFPIAAVVSAALITLTALAVTLKRIGRSGYTVTGLVKASGWRPVMAMLITGTAAGLAFVIADQWVWPSLIRRVAQVAGGAPAEFPAAMIVGPLALFAGGFAASLLSGRFRLRPHGWQQALQSFAGGIIMGGSAALIPGGNDVMLFHALPSLALSGVVAYAAMFAVLVPSLYALDRLPILAGFAGRDRPGHDHSDRLSRQAM